MKTPVKQFKKAVAGILSIAVLSSAMVMTTVSPSSAKQVRHVTETELKGMCVRSNGRWSGSGTGNTYSCVVDRADGSHVDVACDEDDCEGNIYKKDMARGSSKVVLDQKLRNVEQFLAPTTPKKPTASRAKLNTSTSGKLMAN